MRFVVGLGNPGERYRRTRHNVGFMVVDALAARASRGPGREEAGAWIVHADFSGEESFLVKPLTFMNRSGVAVAELLELKGATFRDIVVVVDDIALALGQIRVRERGSHGGHNGLRSLIDVLGTDEFPRVRVGIRKEEQPEDLATFVLEEFPPADVLMVQEAVGRSADAVEMLLREGAVTAMNVFNTSPKV